MANPFHPEPYTEEYQQAAYNGFPFLPEFGHRRTAPREEPFIRWRPQTWEHGHGWYKGGQKLHHFRSKKYWARPVDGCRRGTLGRIKDGLTGRGADVFVVANGDRRTLMREMPKRSHWSHWDSTGLAWPDGQVGNGLGEQAQDMDWYLGANLGATRWARRYPGDVYNFRNRRYQDIRPSNVWNFWGDAHWSDGKRKKGGVPTCWRDWDGFWHTTVDNDAGHWSGGRPLA